MRTSTLEVMNSDELFGLLFVFAAAPDGYFGGHWFTVSFSVESMAPKPGSEAFSDIQLKVEDGGSSGGGGQSYLNSYYGLQIVRLPRICNGSLAINWRTRTHWDTMPE